MKIANVTMTGLLLVASGILFSNLPSWGQRKEPLPVLEINGIRFTIPPGYEGRKSKDPKIFIFKPLEELHTLALLKVYFEHRPTDIPGHDLTPEKMDLFGLSKTAERQATFAGRDGGCIEYSVKTKSGVALAQAECSFGTELHTSFFGEQQNLNVFYAVMRTAEPSGKEQKL